MRKTKAPAVRTPEEVREDFERRGVSISAWARENGVSRALVYSVLQGQRPCRIGHSHKVAVLLGLKNGVISS